MESVPERNNRLPREVCIASIDLRGIWPEETVEKRINDILERMENVYSFEPDVICLPETFQTSWVNERKKLDEYADIKNTKILHRYSLNRRDYSIHMSHST